MELDLAITWSKVGLVHELPATPDLAMGFIFGSARYLSFRCSGYFVAYVAAQNTVCGCGMPSYLACFSSLALYLSFVGCLPFMMYCFFLY